MSRLRRTAEGILDDVRLALQSREPTGGMQVPYLGDWAGVVRTPSGARALEQLRRTLEGALDEPGTPVSMLTPADVETLREDAARANDGWARADDMRALLAHVDALQAQLDVARAVVDATAGDTRWAAAQALRLRLRIQQHVARHLLAWQQARGIEAKEFGREALAWLRGHFDALTDENERLTSERDLARAEVERLREAAVRASAELRHTYRPETRDWNLVSRAIRILEEATTPTAALSKTGGER